MSTLTADHAMAWLQDAIETREHMKGASGGPECTALERKALKLMKAYGFPFERRRDRRTLPCWDGTIAHLRHLTWYNLLHELAHWLVCPPERREDINYGIGASPEDNDDLTGYVSPLTIDKKAAQEEEHRASILGIFLEARIGFTPTDRLEEHSWTDFNWADPSNPNQEVDWSEGGRVDDVIRSLFDSGHLNWVPFTPLPSWETT